MRFKDIQYALRHIVRYKEYSLLNVIGLSLGMACAILILLWVEQQVHTNKFHNYGKDIYLMRKMTSYSDGRTYIDPALTAPFAPIIEEEVPEVIAAVRVTWQNKILFRKGEKMSYEDGHYADSTFFQVFSFPLIMGDSATALDNPNSVVISKKLADKYFEASNPIGQTIRIRDNKEELYTITGVFSDVPSYSSVKFDYILPFSKYIEQNSSMIHWGNFHLMTFLHVEPGTPTALLDKKINELYKEHGTWELPSFFVQPFEEIYLYGDFGETKESATGLILYVKILSLIALFIIFLACMNYTNLATAISTRRGREVGVKKVFGSGKRYIFRQFTLEAVVLTLLAFILAIILVSFALPFFNQLINTELSFGFNQPRIILLALLVPVVTGLLAGIFPSVYMSSFKPLAILRNQGNPNKGVPALRQGLVIFQFVITIAFIISSVLIFKQLKYIQNKKLGLEEDNVIFFPQSLYIQEHKEAFKAQLLEQPGVLSVSYTSNSPLSVGSNTSDPRWRGKSPDDQFSIPYLQADADMCEVFGVDIIAGRNFRESIASDTNSILINETFARIIGLDDPVGELIHYWGRTATIVGVVKDFHIGSIRQPIQQLMILNRPSDTWLTMIRISGKMREKAIKNVEKTFRQFDQSVPFEYRFIDEEYAKNYETDKYLSRLALLFTVLSIIISCMGLFGLALFTAEQRTKEIGIRKSIGAKTSQVMGMLTKKFLAWVSISFVLASVIAWYLMQLWLDGFAYHTELSWWVFAITGLTALTIALVTVSWQAYRAANRNPVESLRYE